MLIITIIILFCIFLSFSEAPLMNHWSLDHLLFPSTTPEELGLTGNRLLLLRGLLLRLLRWTFDFVEESEETAFDGRVLLLLLLLHGDTWRDKGKPSCSDTPGWRIERHRLQGGVNTAVQTQLLVEGVELLLDLLGTRAVISCAETQQDVYLHKHKNKST